MKSNIRKAGLVALVGAIIGVGVYGCKKEKLSVRVVGISHYESKNPPRFSFDYPEFEKWYTEVGENELRYHPGKDINILFEYPPSVTFSQIAMKVTSDFWNNASVNRNGIKYLDMGHEEETAKNLTTFKLNGEQIEMRSPKGQDHPKFSGDIIWKTIVGSFDKE